MRLKTSLVMVLCLCTLPIFSQTSETAAPEDTPLVTRIFALNLWSGPVDIKLGEDSLFSTTGLASSAASRMVALSAIAPRPILFRASPSQTWLENKKADGSPLHYDIRAGRTYMILVQENGTPGLYELSAPEGDRPKIAIVNTTGVTLERVRIGAGAEQGIAILADGLGPGWTNFGDLSQGSYGTFWSTGDASYEHLRGKDGLTVGFTRFSDKSWYLVVVHPVASSSVVWEISPE